MADKRKSPPPASFGSTSLVKRQRQDEHAKPNELVIASSDDATNKGLVRSVKRTSSLSSPIIGLTGAHGAEILDCKFSHDGSHLAAASSDRTISIWNTYSENENIGQLVGHSKAVTCLSFSFHSSDTLFSASADTTIIVWSLRTGQKLRRLRGHRAIINAIASTRSGTEILVSGSDDGKVMLWDPQQKDPLDVIHVGYPVTAVAFSDDASQVFVGGLDNEIHIYDLSRKAIVFSLRGHMDTITSIALSPSGSHLLSTSFDDTLRIWDVRPFSSSSDRLYRTLRGTTFGGFENLLIKAAWSTNGERIVAGGADRTCTIWEVETERILYKLPGHRGTCTAAAYHPREPIVLSCSTDMTIMLGEVEA